MIFIHTSYVKMFLTRVQFAWVNYRINPSETENNISRWDMKSSYKFKSIGFKNSLHSLNLLRNFHHTTSHKREELNFKQWLVGFTDGDGSFNIDINEQFNKIIFSFKISQKISNLRALYFIKKILKIGSVTKDKNGFAHFFIRDITQLKNIIIPIFIDFPLLTNKEFLFHQFIKCIIIAEDNTLSLENKIELIKKEQSIKCKDNYIPSKLRIFYDLDKLYNLNLSIKDSQIKIPSINNSPLTKSWIVGFLETQDCFYITHHPKLIHGFRIILKRDEIVLQNILTVLNIIGTVKYNNNDSYSIEIFNSESLKKIKEYFFNTFKGMKSLDYRIWARTFKHKGKNEELFKIQSLLKRISNR